MSRVRETLQQEEGRQLPQGAGVHNRGGMPTTVEIEIKRPVNTRRMMRRNGNRGR